MAIDMETRNKRIKAALKDGKTIAEVATKFDLSTARIWKVANDYVERPAKSNGKPKKARAKTAAKRANGKRKALGITKAQSARKPAVTKKVLAAKPKVDLSAAAAAVQG